MAKLAVSKKGGSLEGNFMEYAGYGMLAFIAFAVLFPEQFGRNLGSGTAGGILGFLGGLGRSVMDLFAGIFGGPGAGGEPPAGGNHEGEQGEVNAGTTAFPGGGDHAAIWNLHGANAGRSGLYFDSGVTEFAGSKLRWLSPPGVASDLPDLDYERYGRVATSPAKTGKYGASHTGTWRISPDLYIGTGLSGSAGRRVSMQGDIRALTLFVSILQVAGIKTLGRLECLSSSANHSTGRSFDWYAKAGSADESSFNDFLRVCYQRNIPIAWISPVPYTDSKGRTRWPMFQIRNGKKVRYASSGGNHSNPRHYHIDMPRIGWFEALRP